MRFKDQTVIVTGGARGIGRGIATAFAEGGADVIIVSRRISASRMPAPNSSISPWKKPAGWIAWSIMPGADRP